MYIIKPITVTAAMIGAGCTLSEDPTAAWASGTFAIGDEVHVVAQHRVYRCAIAGASSISPELDPTRWLDVRPTNKMAPFDIYTSTAATTTASDIVYPITARFVNAVSVWAPVGATVELSIKDEVGGTKIYPAGADAADVRRIKRESTGWYDYLFGERTSVKKVVFTGLPIRPAAEITVAIRAASGATRAVGMIALGKFANLLGGADAWGGVQYGAEAEPVSYNYITTDDDGVITIEPGYSATNLKVDVMLAQEYADAAQELLESVLGVPVAWISTLQSGYDGLSTFGIGRSTPVRRDGPTHAKATINVQGII